MRLILAFCSMTLCAIAQLASAAESANPPQGPSGGVPLTQILERAAERLNKNFVIDPRVNSEVRLFGISPDQLSYRELQAVLEVHGWATEEDGNLIKIIPDANARQYSTPLVAQRSAGIGNDDVVTKIIDVAPLEATQLVPILRPLMPQQAHLVAVSRTNSLLLVDRYANVQRIEAIVRELQRKPIAPDASLPTAAK